VETTVRRLELLRCLELTKPGLSPKGMIEQSNCYVFRKGRVFTWNSEVSCRMKSGLPETIEAAVPARSLEAILSKMEEEDELVPVVDGGELRFKGRKGQTGLRMEAAVTLPIDTVERPGAWHDLDEGFCDGLGMVAECCGRDDSDWNCSSVRFTAAGIESTDRYQSARFKADTGLKSPALLKRDAAVAVAKLDANRVSATEKWLHFGNPNGLLISCVKYKEEAYPDLSRHFKKKDGEQPLVLPKGLVGAAQRGEIFSAEDAEHNYLFVDIRPGELRVRGEGGSGWYRERKKLNYSGPPMTALIKPKLLIKVTEEHSECWLTQDSLRVEADRFSYFTTLDTQDDGDANG
jgi:hypothetical protein